MLGSYQLFILAIFEVDTFKEYFPQIESKERQRVSLSLNYGHLQ